MNTLNIAPDQIANLTAQIPAGAINKSTDAVYDPHAGVLIFSDAVAEAINAAYANLAGGIKIRMKAYAASVRYGKEIGGVTVNGSLFPSDRESQAKFTAAAVMSQINPQAAFNWKTDAGFVALKGADMIAIASTVGAWVQRCFDKESVVGAAIDAGTMTTTAEIDQAFAVV